MAPVKTSSFQLPDGKTVETVYVKLRDGRIVARTPGELVKQPAPPAVNK